jgi:hypothetical protein
VTWRFHVLDLPTMTNAARRGANIDDQIEWLDDGSSSRVLTDGPWIVPATGRRARRYVSRAVSPAVIRAAINAPLPGEARTQPRAPPSDIAVAMSAA